MNEEYKSKQDNKEWELVPLPEGANPWNANGNVEGYKARLVVKGFTQRERIEVGFSSMVL